jgi:tryptophanyl-tRNA synthetase
VKNWVKLQQPQFTNLYCIVDLHALTVYFDPAELPTRILDLAIGFLACGVDPEGSSLFVQSQVREHTQLSWILGTVAPMGDLERMTQFKEKSEQHKKNVNAGLFTYPVLQSADILLYKARGVPVGDDQVQHIELCRTVARKFNGRYGEVFPLPSAMLTEVPRIMGLQDPAVKMSKSKDNTIVLNESSEVIWEKLRTAATDPARARRKDPGNPDKCNIGTLHRALSSPAENDEIRAGCTSASIGCFDCKKMLHKNLMTEIAPIQERERALSARPDEVRDILKRGAAQARSIAEKTLDEVEQKMGLPGRFLA